MKDLSLRQETVFALTDGVTVTVDVAKGHRFTLSGGTGRTIVPSGPGYDGQTISIRWKNTGGSPITHTFDTGATDKFRFLGSANSVNPTAAGASDYIVAQYHDADDRWDIIGYSGADFPAVSSLIATRFDVLYAAMDGRDCVLSGGAVTAQGSPNMTVAVAKCAVLTNGVLKAVAAGNGTITSADSTNPRYDLVVINSSGAIAVRAGTPAAIPSPPARTANDVVLAIVYVPAGDTAIETAQITDIRATRTVGPILIYKTTTAETTNGTTAAINVLDKTNSGVSIPNGLFLAGRTLRCRIAGNFLINSTTTPTLTLAIVYGGTTMFADATVAGAQDADRGAWFLDFQIAAQANNDQALVGSVAIDPVIAQRVAPTTGQAGNLALSATTANQTHIAPFAGSAAVDSDAANRVLAVTWTFSGTAQAANEIVTESATLEIL